MFLRPRVAAGPYLDAALGGCLQPNNSRKLPRVPPAEDIGFVAPEVRAKVTRAGSGTADFSQPTSA